MPSVFLRFNKNYHDFCFGGFSCKVLQYQSGTMPPKAFWLFDEKFSIQAIPMDNDFKMVKREKGYIQLAGLSPLFPLLFSSPLPLKSYFFEAPIGGEQEVDLNRLKFIIGIHDQDVVVVVPQLETKQEEEEEEEENLE